MLRLNIEDLKLEFVRTVYESITKQIQQMDLKMSVIISWNGAMAVMLAKQVTDMIAGGAVHFLPVVLMVGVMGSMVFSGFFTFQVMKPRKAKAGGTSEGFAGLLYSGDILDLGPTARERISRYTQELLDISTHDQLYRQFTKSIVLISQIQERKNSLFVQALLTSVVSFTLLLALMMVMSLILPG